VHVITLIESQARHPVRQPSPWAHPIHTDPDHDQGTLDGLALVVGHGVLDAAGLLGIPPVEIRQQVEDAAGREGSQHLFQGSFGFSFFHFDTLIQQTSV
jgi:hypothetical protein